MILYNHLNFGGGNFEFPFLFHRNNFSSISYTFRAAVKLEIRETSWNFRIRNLWQPWLYTLHSFKSSVFTFHFIRFLYEASREILIARGERTINLYSLKKPRRCRTDIWRRNEGKCLKHSRIANKRLCSSLSPAYRLRFMPVEGLISQISGSPPFHADRWRLVPAGLHRPIKETCIVT